MKKFTFWHLIIVLIVVIFLDQWLKIYIKTHFVLGEEKMLMGQWFRLHFLENPGMAFGLTFGNYGTISKIILSIIRIVIIVIGFYYMLKAIQKKRHFWLLFSWSLVIAGAIGNLLDGIFYGLMFNESGSIYNPSLAVFLPEGGGYAGIFQGKVVDMLYFPLIQTTFPSWFPFWGGESFEFFRPVFNIADSSISVGIILVLILSNFVYKPPKPALSVKK